MAGRIFQDAIDRARFSTKDTSATPRVTDAEFIMWCNDFIETAVDLRPDLFRGLLGTTFPPDVAYAATDVIPGGSRMTAVCADYLIFRAEMKDDEHVLEERAAMSAQFFRGRLTG